VLSGSGAQITSATNTVVVGGGAAYSTGTSGGSSSFLGVTAIGGRAGNGSTGSAGTSGAGLIAGPVSVVSGGTLAPGNSIQSLATGTATFAGGATFAYEVDSTNPLSLGAAADLANFSGDYLPSGRFVAFKAVPEPTSCVIALAGLACGVSVVRRRRRTRA